MGQTTISWTDITWNPVTGCSRVSEGCRHCYAERISLKFRMSKEPWTAANAPENIILHPQRLKDPYTWKRPSRVFVNSMSDMFHELIPDSFIADMFVVMMANPRHTFQILTKRAERAAGWPGPWGPNIWMGVSIEDAKNLNRLDSLRKCGAAVKFVSFEPLLGPLGKIDLSGIDWVIVGGESGPGFRPMEMAWVRSIRDQCVADGKAFFFKQDAAYRSETRPYLVEEDGSCWQWQQFHGEMMPPVQVGAAQVKVEVSA